MNCQWCKSEIPENSTFCLSCGRPLSEKGVDIILPPDGSNTESRATIYMMLAIMALFFGFFLLIPGYFVGLGLIAVSVGLIIVGFILLAARYYVLARYASGIEKFRREAVVKVTCRYCGNSNPRSFEKCERCGAPLDWSSAKT